MKCTSHQSPPTPASSAQSFASTPPPLPLPRYNAPLSPMSLAERSRCVRRARRPPRTVMAAATTAAPANPSRAPLRLNTSRPGGAACPAPPCGVRRAWHEPAMARAPTAPSGFPSRRSSRSTGVPRTEAEEAAEEEEEEGESSYNTGVPRTEEEEAEAEEEEEGECSYNTGVPQTEEEEEEEGACSYNIGVPRTEEDATAAADRSPLATALVAAVAAAEVGAGRAASMASASAAPPSAPIPFIGISRRSRAASAWLPAAVAANAMAPAHPNALCPIVQWRNLKSKADFESGSS